MTLCSVLFALRAFLGNDFIDGSLCALGTTVLEQRVQAVVDAIRAVSNYTTTVVLTGYTQARETFPQAYGMPLCTTGKFAEMQDAILRVRRATKIPGVFGLGGGTPWESAQGSGRDQDGAE